jgi:3-isopropylmalate/(R)-2-methylmalate dehydratase small subunit
MTAFTNSTSRTCVVLPNENIDTDQIIPARFLSTTTRKGLGARVQRLALMQRMAANRAEFPFNQRTTPDAASCMAGTQLRLRLLARTRALGTDRPRLRAVISSGDRRHLPQQRLKNGLLPIVLDEAECRSLMLRPDDELHIDVAGEHPTHPDGRRRLPAGCLRTHLPARRRGRDGLPAGSRRCHLHF